MIEEAHGDLLKADVDALVNTVNTEGVMGKGIALQFRRAFPTMYDAYRSACRCGDVQIGRMWVWETGMAAGPRFIINFPTKRHWRSKSRIVDIEDGLSDLVHVIQERRIASIAIPPLGAGNGGLPWGMVRERIMTALSGLAGVQVLLYEPQGAPAPHLMRTASPAEPLTENRAVFIQLLGRYTMELMDGRPSLIEVQKLMYFLQEAGQPLRLRFVRGTYGPYADNLRHVLINTEGTYTIGYGDGTDRALDSSLELVPGAWGQAVAVLESHPESQNRSDRVMELADGFESMYGMELLGTVHWLVAHDKVPRDEVGAVQRGVAAWSPRKAKLFRPEHVSIALEHLRGLGWV